MSRDCVAIVSHVAIDRQRRLFAILEEFFHRATGEDIGKFARRGKFAEVVRTEANRLAGRGGPAFEWFETEYRAFQGAERMTPFRDAAALGGIKLVLGGSSRFGAAQLGSVRKMLLYADTILLPDPVLPWFEQSREEERFRHVIVLQTVFSLLHLKPFVDADLPYPAIVVFPSWERSLELSDEETRERQQALISATIGQHIGQVFGSFGDLASFASAREAEFLSAVDGAQLFLAPGAVAAEPLEQALERYWRDLREWRSEDHLKTLQSLPKGHFVLNGLVERLGPQYHMLENAEELRAQPMMCLDSHWYYHRLISSALETKLAHAGMLSDEAVSTLRAINQPALGWLGNVPTSSLIELRQDNANEDFRRNLAGYTDRLHQANLENLDQVAAEVGRGLATLIAKHQGEMRRIKEDYRLAHAKTLAAGVVTGAALFVPALAPFVGNLAAPVGLAAKFVYDKAKEGLEKTRAARSLTGILAKAHSLSSDD